MSEKVQDCPHCGARMKNWLAPPESSWGTTVQLVCFNDDCPYYTRGWQHMMDKYEQKASYRHRHNPESNEHGPLPVWSANALREGILDDEEEK